MSQHPLTALAAARLFPRRRNFNSALAAAVASVLMPVGTGAQTLDKPVRLVVGFGPGSGSDIQARAIAEVLARELKSPVIVENRPGAAGMLAAAHVAAAPPDGHTLMLGTTTLVVTLPILSRNARYDTQDFTPIGSTGKSALALVVPNKPGSPTTLKDLIAAMKSSSVSYGSLGPGSFGHLGSMRLMQQAGVSAVHVPYKSSPQELQDLVAGHLAFVMDGALITLPLIRSGVLRPLAVTSTHRLAALPDVPTIGEALGSPFEHTVWTGLFAPKGTPAAVTQKLSTALKAVLDDKEVQARFNSMQLLPFYLDATGFAGHIGREAIAWRAFLEKSGIRLEE
jgi:tripartite-type tricarboxylate transporter receptor subunit TctC